MIGSCSQPTVCYVFIVVSWPRSYMSCGSVFFNEGWNVLDFTIVTVDLILLVLGWAVANMPSVSVLRIFRLVRLARAVRAAKSFKELNALIRSFGFALKAIFWGILMIIMILTIWSILAVQLLHPINVALVEKNPDIYIIAGCERCHRAFSSVFESNLTFFQHVVAGDSWGNVSLPIITEAPWTSILFLMVIVTVNLTMLNLILAVIVEAGAKATEEDQHQQALEAQKKVRKAEARLIELCSTLDVDFSGSLNIEEFLTGYSVNKEFADCLESMNVTQSDIHMIFNICDEDGSGDVNYVEFVEQLRRIRKQGEQMLLYYVTEIRHKVQQLKLVLLDHHEVKNDDNMDCCHEAGENGAQNDHGDAALSAQPGATGQLALAAQLRSTGGILSQELIDALPEKSAVMGAAPQAKDSKVKQTADVAEVLLVRPAPPEKTPAGKLPTDGPVLFLSTAADTKSPVVEEIWTQIGGNSALNEETRGTALMSGGRRVECSLTGGTNEEKLTLCSVQLENVLRMNQDIATLMKDVALQSKLHTGLLNTIAAEVPTSRRIEIVDPGILPGMRGSSCGPGSSRLSLSGRCCTPEQPVPVRAV